MRVLALDLATTSGWALGHVGGEPTYGSVSFASPGASDKAVFNAALRWGQNFLKEPRADLLAIEALLPPTVVRGRTNAQTIYRLAGLHGIIIAVAFEYGIYRIETPTVGDIRGHFIGDRGHRRERAKREVICKCRTLGWNPKTDNEGDALATWHLQCSLIDPRLALQVSPLFKQGIAL